CIFCGKEFSGEEPQITHRCMMHLVFRHPKEIGGTGGWSHEYEQQKSPYCPNCGAKMDGGAENAEHTGNNDNLP
ncbi:MAG: hypothetical protein SOW24_01930, partial [Eubacteriales bacterium]|nr:hypothetical protein [Eubacteriales bacterium]